MNKIINKALFYKEWINLRWVTLLTIIILLYFKSYDVISSLNQNKMLIKYSGGVLTCLFLYLSYLFYKKRNLEYNLRLVSFKNLEPLFIGGFLVCLGLLAGNLLGRGNLSVFWICFAAFSVLGYFLSKLLLKVLSSGK